MKFFSFFVTLPLMREQGEEDAAEPRLVGVAPSKDF
jgi:hypothetical protein